MSPPSNPIRPFQIKLLRYPVLPSTNDKARELLDLGMVKHGALIVAEYQENGRGQQGNSWQGDPGANGYLSLILELNLSVEKQFLLNMAVSLAVCALFDGHGLEPQIKWPNDVYCGGKKLAGILIENSLQGNYINQSIIGVGININQTYFGDMKKAGSLALALGKKLDLEEVLQGFIALLEKLPQGMNQPHLIRNNYHDRLLHCGKIAPFESNGRVFKGKVLGVDNAGRLMLEEKGKQLLFANKEIKWLNV